MRSVLIITGIVFVLGAVAGNAGAQDGILISGEQTLGVRQIDLSTNSSKFNQYRDLRNGFYLGGLQFDLLETQRAWYADFSGYELLRDDQSIYFRVGNYSQRWHLTVDHNETPHRFSNRAMTPYIDRGGGVFTVPGKVPIINDGNDATGTPSLVPTTGQMAVNDALIAEYVKTYVHPVELEKRRERTRGTLNLSDVGGLKFRLAYSDERRKGSFLSYAPIGDRPPRTLNTQITEPIDNIAREVEANAQYSAKRVRTQLRYNLSMFDNRLDYMRWENLFFAPNVGADYATTVPGTARNVSDYGQRSLAPDNFAHNVSLTTGVDLPMNSKLTSTIASGYMRQNVDLLPYSVSTLGGDVNPQRGDSLNWNDLAKLPRAKADAKMTTLKLDVDYSVNPVNRLNLRPFVRYYKLDNKTPTAEWRYVTQDVAGTDGDVNYRNYRRNLAYAYDRLTFGIDARHYLSFWRTTVGLGYSRESIDRDFREANTDEDIFQASIRTKPSQLLTLSARYLMGNRKGDGYDYRVTSQTYWYSFAQGAAEVDNPQFLFADHPDLRRYDVSDRERNEFSVTGALATRSKIDLSATYRFRKDDFDSDVKPVAPLSGTTVPIPNLADTSAQTPGQQLGLLKDRRQNITVDLHYAASDRWTFTAFADREEVKSDTRGMVFNENQRREPSNPGIQAPTSLGPWTDPDRLYNVESEQTTNTFGVGVSFAVIPDKVRLRTDYSLSRTEIDLNYTGYGSDTTYLGRNWETFQFGFNSPGTVHYNLYEVNASLDYQLTKGIVLGFHYLFNWYRVVDWMLEPGGPWVEEVESEYFWRDTSRDNRWGNRIVTMGGYLAPNYRAHVGFVTMTLKF